MILAAFASAAVVALILWYGTRTPFDQHADEALAVVDEHDEIAEADYALWEIECGWAEL